MKSSFWLAALAVISHSGATLALSHELLKRQSSANSTTVSLMPVPVYNISMPLDHFNPDDTRVFNVTFFVNDTYYKPGGPVVYFDFGEQGISDNVYSAGGVLGGWVGVISAPLELAKSLNGVVVALEHRYFGYSQPFPLTETGEPVGGAAAYKYLTVRQALEDVVFFANAFNETRLDRNTVLSSKCATQLLGPSDTPWIWVGASYSGSRGAWSRLLRPDIFYAAWSSSAPVQTMPDGAAYWNTIYRAVPRNCTSDVQAVVNAVDDILVSGSAEAVRDLKRLAFIAVNWLQLAPHLSQLTLEAIDDLTVNVTDQLLADMLVSNVAFGEVQVSGVSHTIQPFCDFIEQFDGASYLKNISQYANDTLNYYLAAFYNPDDESPPADGIVASADGENGADAAASVGIAAYMYSLKQIVPYYLNLDAAATIQPPSSTNGTAAFGAADPMTDADTQALSWDWLVLNDLGLITDTNATSPLRLGSRLLNYSYAHPALERTSYPNFAPDAFPPNPDTADLLSLGGWHMQPSNTMFTVGEFDPWRGFSVLSLEQDTLGAPLRTATRRVPACGCPPEASSEATDDVFGIVYGGAAHGEDMGIVLGELTGSQDVENPPVRQGVELFLEAWKVWAPCFRTQGA